MQINIFLYIISIFAIEMLLFYSPAYYLSFGVLKLNEKIKDLYLTIILLILSILLSLFCFPFFFNIITEFVR